MSNPGAASTITTANPGLGSPAQVGMSGGYVGFYGATPVVRANAITAVSTSALVAVSGAYGFATEAQATAIVSAVNNLITACKNIGITS